MLRRTSTLDAPSMIIRSEKKHLARMEAMELILNSVDYARPRSRARLRPRPGGGRLGRPGLEPYWRVSASRAATSPSEPSACFRVGPGRIRSVSCLQAPGSSVGSRSKRPPPWPARSGVRTRSTTGPTSPPAMVRRAPIPASWRAHRHAGPSQSPASAKCTSPVTRRRARRRTARPEPGVLDRGHPGAAMVIARGRRPTTGRRSPWSVPRHPIDDVADHGEVDHGGGVGHLGHVPRDPPRPRPSRSGRIDAHGGGLDGLDRIADRPAARRAPRRPAWRATPSPRADPGRGPTP